MVEEIVEGPFQMATDLPGELFGEPVYPQAAEQVTMMGKRVRIIGPKGASRVIGLTGKVVDAHAHKYPTFSVQAYRVKMDKPLPGADVMQAEGVWFNEDDLEVML